MLKAPFAERLIAQVSTPQCASAIVGDLLEEKVSPVAFWFGITGILFAMSWRWIAGFILALISLPVTMFSYSQLIPSRHAGPWMMGAMQLVVAASCVGTGSGFVLCRYGVRAPVTMMSVGIWTALTVSACSSLILPGSHVFDLLMGIAIASLLLIHRTRKLAVSALVPPTVFAVTFGSLFCGTRLVSLNSPSLVRSFIAFMAPLLVGLVAEAVVLARMHNLVFHPELAAIEPKEHGRRLDPQP